MVSGYTAVADPDTTAKALGKEMPISPKFAREVVGMIRGMKVETARQALEDVMAKKRQSLSRGTTSASPTRSASDPEGTP